MYENIGLKGLMQELNDIYTRCSDGFSYNVDTENSILHIEIDETKYPDLKNTIGLTIDRFDDICSKAVTGKLSKYKTIFNIPLKLY